MNSKLSLGNKIHELLRSNGMKQKDLAEKCGISTSSVSEYVKGKKMPNAEVISKIASALGVTVGYLTGIETTDKESLDNFMSFCDNRAKDLESKRENALSLDPPDTATATALYHEIVSCKYIVPYLVKEYLQNCESSNQ